MPERPRAIKRLNSLLGAVTIGHRSPALCQVARAEPARQQDSGRNARWTGIRAGAHRAQYRLPTQPAARDRRAAALDVGLV